MGYKKPLVERIVYAIATVLVVVSVGLCIAGLLLPDWWEEKYHEGIVVVKIKMGPWQDEICRGDTGCKNFWMTDSDYDRPHNITIPDYKLIRGFLTAGVIVGCLALLSTIPFWICLFKYSSSAWKHRGFIVFYTLCMISGFFNLVGVLIIASKDNERHEEDYAEWAPFLSGVGGALLFIAGCLSCIVCRHDPTYGTLENPVSPDFGSA